MTEITDMAGSWVRSNISRLCLIDPRDKVESSHIRILKYVTLVSIMLPILSAIMRSV